MAVIFGSSHVNHLFRWCRDTGRCLSHVRERYFLGGSGMNVRSVRSDLKEKLRVIRPRCVFFMLGGNDISDTSCPADIVGAFRELVQFARVECGVEYVYIFELFPRTVFKFSKTMSVAAYNRQRASINRGLQRLDGVTVVHSSHLRQASKVLDNRGVHLNSHGQELVFHTISHFISTVFV